MAYKVLIPQDIAKEGKQYLIDRGYEIMMGSGITVEDIKKDVKDCDAILARTASFPREVFEAGKKLKVIARHGVAYDNVDIDAATDLGIYVTNAPLSNANSVAEQAIGFIIALAKNTVFCDKELRKGNFEIRNQLHGIELEGKILGLIGLGKIGNAVAQKSTYGLGMKVIAYDPYVKQENVDSYIKLVEDLDEIFKNADFISLHLPLTDKTRRMVGREKLQMMKTTAYLINTSRGNVVNEKELIVALKEGQLAGAGLDVYEQEPPENNNELFSLDNVVVTPHNSSHTKEATQRMAIHAAMGIDEVLSGEIPSWPVNKPIIR
ncbi:hydroxyacid dehydrogenase [Irregularibacter muris]|uniref:Hydroxyacid dehydrogenase n=1 Tax=Irregularibacter muris TaxID=1796619 RepID=A0AAE3KZI3_9FIRM|nr:hydroxyacid dehydrogenase [Irregularibacter muris]MCR1898741.1 hydroxyacid dehydrogenase [Irregularibacter muris]